MRTDTISQTAPSGATPAQTIGPFFGDGLAWLTAPLPVASAPIRVSGKVLDGAGTPVSDALIEAWSPNAVSGQSDAGQITGFQRVASDSEGGFTLHLPAPDSGEPAAYITLFSRGLMEHRFTAVWLAGAAHGALWQQVPEARRATLCATVCATAIANDAKAFEWNIVMQGAVETVFFEYT
jgi:protocatechuate 3,4-dioxygenase, alpha subunit